MTHNPAIECKTFVTQYLSYSVGEAYGFVMTHCSEIELERVSGIWLLKYCFLVMLLSVFCVSYNNPQCGVFCALGFPGHTYIFTEPENV